jgi:dihydrofolate synthase/folylpolyglutamate synthase
LTVLESLSDRLPLDRSAIVRGLQSVRLPGRFQVIRTDVEWILDVAHNPAAARVLAATLALQSSQAGAADRPIAVCGILGDKDIESVAAELRDSFAQWVVVRPASARAIDEHVLAERLRRCGANVTAIVPTVVAGCETARALARPGDRIVVFGSFLTVGPALEWLQADAQAE